MNNRQDPAGSAKTLNYKNTTVPWLKKRPKSVTKISVMRSMSTRYMTKAWVNMDFTLPE